VLAAFWLFAIVWTGSAASAAAADRSPTPAPVEYYIVPPTGHGPANLFEIAAQTLGNGSRFMQIFALNKGRLQPNGGRLENPRIIEPGWVLELPPDAKGPGVRVGQLPQPTPSASAAPPSRSPSRSGAAPSSSAVVMVVASLALVVAGTLMAVGARLAMPRRGRRRRVTGPGRRRGRDRVDHFRPSEAVPPGPAVTGQMDWSWPSNAVWPEGWPADHPSGPQQAVGCRASPDGQPPGPGGMVADVRTLAAAPAGSGPGAQVLRPADALRVVSLLLSEADAEASKIRAEAIAVREQATAQAAAAVREAAGREAGELRASMEALSAELGRVAAFVTQRLTIPAEPATEPAVGAVSPESPVRPASTPDRGPLTRPGTLPKDTPRTAKAAKPGGRSRQIRSARIVVAAFISMALISTASGTVEILLHGFPFFVFRSAGTGTTPSGGLQEDQGPGQPNAPGSRRHAAQHHHHTKQPHRLAKHHAGGSAH
jgi:hypothetical protein